MSVPFLSGNCFPFNLQSPAVNRLPLACQKDGAGAYASDVGHETANRRDYSGGFVLVIIYNNSRCVFSKCFLKSRVTKHPLKSGFSSMSNTIPGVQKKILGRPNVPYLLWEQKSRSGYSNYIYSYAYIFRSSNRRRDRSFFACGTRLRQDTTNARHKSGVHDQFS